MISQRHSQLEQNLHEKDKIDVKDDYEEYMSSIDTEEGSQILELDSTSSESKRSRKFKKGHEKKHSFSIQKSVFRNILKEILLDRSISEEAVQILHTTSENYAVGLFSKAKKIMDQSNRKTMTDQDLKLVLELIK